MTVGMVLALAAVVAGNAQGAPDVAVPLAPSSKWVIGHQDGMCTLFREFGVPAPDAVAFGLKPTTLGDTVTVVATLPKDQAVRRRKAEKTGLTMLPSGTSIPIKDERSSKTKDGGLAVVLTIDRAGLSRVMATPALAIEANDFTVSIAPTASAKALAALTACEARLVAQWGIDPAAVAVVATLATPAHGESSVDWIDFRDYPAVALARNGEGATVILWQIGVDGRVGGCRSVESSGDRALDFAACNAITKRARYTPARDKDGHRVTSWKATRVSFRIVEP